MVLILIEPPPPPPPPSKKMVAIPVDELYCAVETPEPLKLIKVTAYPTTPPVVPIPIPLLGLEVRFRKLPSPK